MDQKCLTCNIIVNANFTCGSCFDDYLQTAVYTYNTVADSVNSSIVLTPSTLCKTTCTQPPWHSITSPTAQFRGPVVLAGYCRQQTKFRYWLQQPPVYLRRRWHVVPLSSASCRCLWEWRQCLNTSSFSYAWYGIIVFNTHRIGTWAR